MTKLGFLVEFELTDDRSLRAVWTDDVGLAEAISGLEVLANGLIFGRNGWDRAAGFVRVMAHHCDLSSYCPRDMCSGCFGVVQVTDEVAQASHLGTKHLGLRYCPLHRQEFPISAEKFLRLSPLRRLAATRFRLIEELSTSHPPGRDLQLELIFISRAFVALLRSQNIDSVIGLLDMNRGARAGSLLSHRVDTYL